MDQRFLPLLLVVTLAFIVPISLARFRRVPVVVGEILAGIFIGPSILGWVHAEDPTLDIRHVRLLQADRDREVLFV